LSERARNAMSSDAPTMSGRAVPNRTHVAESKPPRRYEKIWRRPAPDTNIAIESPAASSEAIA
jgi:hypothetical protein